MDAAKATAEYDLEAGLSALPLTPTIEDDVGNMVQCPMELIHFHEICKRVLSLVSKPTTIRSR